MVERITTQKHEDGTTSVWKFNDTEVQKRIKVLDGNYQTRTQWEVSDVQHRRVAE